MEKNVKKWRNTVENLYLIFPLRHVIMRKIPKIKDYHFMEIKLFFPFDERNFGLHKP